MSQILMVDLRSQYLKLKTEIDAAMAEVLDNTQFIRGAKVAEFENALAAYHDSRYAVGVGNGTDALMIALMALDVKAGEEIITPGFSYVAAAEAMVILGIKPVFADVDPVTMNVDPAAVKKAITAQTRAILPVHLFGQCAEMEEIMNIAKEHNLFVIEDNAQSIGAEYTFKNGEKVKSGAMGDISATSFFPSKNLGCFGDGGAVITNSPELAEKIKMIANHGQRKKYFHEMIGVNSRLDTLQAAVLQVKLSYLDRFIAARKKAADHYDQKFKAHQNLIIPGRNPYSTHVFHQYTLRLKHVQREALISGLEKAGIPSMVYYPHPLNTLTPYRQQGHFPVTEELCSSVISLPLHTEMNDEMLNFISDTVLEVLDKIKQKKSAL